MTGWRRPGVLAATQDQVPVIRDVTFVLISFSAAQAPATTSVATVAMNDFISCSVFICAGLA